MKFPKQILAEAKNMLRSKFILISMILAFVFITAGVPVLGMVVEKLVENQYSYYSSYNESITVDGVTISPDNDFYWEIQNYSSQRDYIADWFDNEQAAEYAVELNEEMLAFYLKYAPLITPWSYEDGYYRSDYRTGLMYTMRTYVNDLWVLSLEDPDIEALTMAVEMVSYGQVSTLFEMSEEDIAEYKENMERDLAAFDELMLNDDFSKYVEIQSRIYEQEIESNLARLETLEADIIANPDQEDYIADEIKYLERYNKNIEENYLPELAYRLEHNVIPSDGSWQDLALNSITSAKSTITRATDDKMTKEQFEDDTWTKREYGTYANYEKALAIEVQEANVDIFVAQSSLESDAPDMSFVQSGARQNLYNMFSLSMLVVVFGALVGGWCIASEFQSGTVRLLMIRPRTRIKIYLSRFFAGLALVYALYAVAFIVTAIVQGALYGFGDYFLPNYTASGTVNFFLMWIGDFFAVSMSAVFIYSLSFAMSAVIKNMAVAMIIPTIALVGTVVGMAFLSSQEPISLIAYTPIPYLTMYDFFGSDYTAVNQLVSKGVPLSIGLGAVVLLLSSAILLVIAGVLFKKKDITN